MASGIELAGVVGLLIGAVLVVAGLWHWFVGRAVTAGKRVSAADVELGERVILEGEISAADETF